MYRKDIYIMDDEFMYVRTYVCPGNKLFVSTFSFKCFCPCTLQCQHNMAYTMATREDLKMEVDEAAGCDVCHKVGVTCEVEMTSVTW